MKRISTVLTIIFGVLAAPILLATIQRRRPAGRLRILIIPQLTRIGDLACATPVFRALKERYPDAYLAVVVSKKAVGVIKNNPRIDEILLIEDHSFFALAKKIRASRFDWSISLVNTSTSALLPLFGLVPERMKTVRRARPVSEFATDWLTPRRVLYEDHTYLPGHYLAMLRPLGIEDTNARPEVFGTPLGDERAEAVVTRALGLPLIGVAITAGNKIKEWGDGKFIELARAIHATYGVALVFIGAPGDAERIQAVVESIGAGTNLVATNVSIEELPSLMKRFALFIAVDTGPIYIAYGLGIPLIDIIGPVDPSEQPPSDERSLQVLPREGIAPSSFVFKRPGKPAEHARAIASITPPDVMAAVGTLADRLRLFARRA